MSSEIFCRDCKEYYCFFDDNEELLVEGCKLDLPLFNNKKGINCNNYLDR